MMNLMQITETRDQMAATVAEMQKRLDRLNAEIVRAKSDGKYSPEYVRETVEELQREALPFFGSKLKELHVSAKAVRAQKIAWSSKPFLLGMQNFSENPQTDAVTRLRYAKEFELMDNGMLTMAARVAAEENDLPVLYQAFLASLKTHGGPQRVDVDLDDVVIPDQAEALAAISAVEALPARGELIAGQATAAGLTALRKMELGRAANVA